MFRKLRKVMLAAALLPLLLAATMDNADASQRGRRGNRSRNYYGSHNRYWNGYWGWYGRSYRPYYNNYYYRGYGYPGYYYSYGYPYYGYGYPYYGNSVGVQIGGLTIGGTWY